MIAGKLFVSRSIICETDSLNGLYEPKTGFSMVSQDWLGKQTDAQNTKLWLHLVVTFKMLDDLTQRLGSIPSLYSFVSI